MEGCKRPPGLSRNAALMGGELEAGVNLDTDVPTLAASQQNRRGEPLAPPILAASGDKRNEGRKP